MARDDFTEPGLSGTVKEIADRHYARRTRHISRNDYEVLCHAADRLRELDADRGGASNSGMSSSNYRSAE